MVIAKVRPAALRQVLSMALWGLCQSQPHMCALGGGCHDGYRGHLDSPAMAQSNVLVGPNQTANSLRQNMPQGPHVTLIVFCTQCTDEWTRWTEAASLGISGIVFMGMIYMQVRP